MRAELLQAGPTLAAAAPRTSRIAHLKGDYGRIGGPESLLRETLPALGNGDPPLFVALQRDLDRPFLAEILGRSALPAAKLRWPGLAAAPLAAAALRRLLVERGVEVIHTHDMRAALAAALIRPFWRGRWVAHVHGWLGETHAPLYRLFEAADRRLIRLADRVVVGSHATAAEVRAAGVGEPIVVPNAVRVPERPDGAARAEARAALKIEPGRIVVGAFGRLHPGKGHDLAIDAAAGLADLPIDLLVAGEGEARAALEARIAAHGLESRVRLLGRTPDIGAFLAAVDMVVVASRKESLPLAALEAMAMGLPVVAAAVGDLPLVLRDGVDGFVVPPDDAPAIAAALRRLAGDEALRARLGREARERIEAFYSVEAHARAIDALDASLARGS